MAYNGSDRRGTENNRRAKDSGKPPPGTVIDRRLGLDPRAKNDPRAGSTDSLEQKTTKPRKTSLVPTSESTQDDSSTGDESGLTGLERKRGRGRRLSEFTKSAEEGEMTTEQFLFLMAIDAFKKGNDRMFPTWTDVLEVIRLLGYRKTMPTELNLPSAEDWLERSDSPANVRPDRWAERFTQTDPQAGPQVGGQVGGQISSSVGPKTEAELTDEALDAFEAVFGEDESDEFLGEDFDSDFDDGFSEAA